MYDAIEARAFLRGVIEASKTGMAPVSEGVKAARTQLELSGDLKKGGPSVNVVNQNIQPTAWMDKSDEEIIGLVEEVLGRRTDPDE